MFTQESPLQASVREGGIPAARLTHSEGERVELSATHITFTYSKRKPLGVGVCVKLKGASNLLTSENKPNVYMCGSPPWCWPRPP